jgi:hypothetical protein
MKKLILLSLALTLSFTTIAAAHPPTPYCSCEFCAENEDRACEDESIPFVYICNDYSALNCPG